MKQSTGIKPLQLELNAGGGQSFVVHAGLLWDEKEVILVDTGIPGHVEQIKKSLERESVPFEKLTKVILTHQDLDHIGSLPELVEATGGRIEVLAHELAVPYIKGELPTIKRGVTVRPCKVDRILQDGDILPFAGGIQVIFTPGHTPDHISLYHQPSKTLLSGDALTSQDGVLMPPNESFTPDMNQALNSVARLIDLDIRTVITYHGGIVTNRIKERLIEIAGKSSDVRGLTTE